MKMVLRSMLVMVSLMYIASAQAEISIDTSDIPLSRCFYEPGFYDAWQDYETWSENSWSMKDRPLADWSPNQAGVHIRSDVNHLYEIRIRFQMSQSDIDFFSNLSFTSGGTRVPMALEVDIIDRESLFGEIGSDDFKIVSDNIPTLAKLKEDVSALDSTKQLSAIIMQPANLQANTLYEIVIQPNGNVPSGRTGKIGMRWQISANYKWIAAMRNGGSSKCDLMPMIRYMSDAVSTGRTDVGYDLVSDYHEYATPEDALSGWYYFTVRGDGSSQFDFTTGAGKNKDIVCWDDDIDSGHDASGAGRCNNGNGNNLFLAQLDYDYTSNVNCPSGANCFTENGITHIIHNNYRCSNDKCWEAGGDTNCWDAHTWYTISNGDVFGPRTNQPREMCDIVYNENPDDSNSGGGTNSEPYIPPGTTSPGTGDDDLSIRRFEISEKDQDNWRHELIFMLTPGESRNIEGELDIKNKGSSKADDVDIDYRIDHGRNFDTDDTKVDEDEEDIDPGETLTKHMSGVRIEVSHDGHNLNVYNRSGSLAETFPFENNFAKFYIFVDAEADSGDDDISSEHSSHNEYGVVKVTMAGFNPIGYVDSANCNAISGWVRDADTTGPIDAHVYADDLYVGPTTAHLTRTDLPFPDKDHGFSFIIPDAYKDGQTRTWKVYGINYPDNGPNPLLERGVREMICDPNYLNVGPLYRVYNSTQGGHYLTTNRVVHDTLPSPWRGEGPAFHVHVTQELDSIPIYVSYRPGKGHIYTGKGEYDVLPAYGFRQEGITFYAYNYHKPGTDPVFRLYRASTQTHLFTANEAEKNAVVAHHGYRLEGIAFYAFNR